MKPNFTEKQLDLIGECVLDSIVRLRASMDNIGITDARVGISKTIHELNDILTIIADSSHEK